MTNSIRAGQSVDMANPFTTDFPFTQYSSNLFQNPNFYHSYQNTLPPYVYHHVQPASPPYQIYTTTYTSYVSSTPMLMTDFTKDYLRHLDDKVIQLDAKMGQIRRLIEKNNTVTNGCDIVQENEFDEACEGSVEVEAGEQESDKLN